MSTRIGEDKRWSIDAHATHELGDAFNAGAPASFALGIDVGGERFQYATTPYNDLTSAATGLTDSAVEGSRQSQAIFAELDVPISKTLELDISDREDRYSDFGRTNNGKLKVRYQPTSYLTVRGSASTGFRAPTLYDLYSPNFLAASSAGTIGQGNPDCGATPVPPFTTTYLQLAGTGVVRRKSEPDARDLAELRFRRHRLADPGSGHHAGLLPDTAEEHDCDHSDLGDLQ